MKPISGKWLEELERLAAHFEERRVRAQARLERVKGDHWYFGLVGLKGDFVRYEFPSIAVLQPVEDPPGLVEVAAALKQTSLLAAIGRYSPTITYELTVRRSFGGSDQGAFNLAWWIISAIRIRTLADVLVPAVSERSWATLAAVKDKSCHVQLIEDAPQARVLEKDRRVRHEDLRWVSNHLTAFADLLENQRFRLAVDSLTTHHHDPNLRVMTAKLWAGIEALFGVEAELSYRISTYVASVLTPRGSARQELYARVRQLYAVRSKAVHGVPVSDEQLTQHVVAVRDLLSRLLSHFTEVGQMPSESDLEESVFG